MFCFVDCELCQIINLKGVSISWSFLYLKVEELVINDLDP